MISYIQTVYIGVLCVVYDTSHATHIHEEEFHLEKQNVRLLLLMIGLLLGMLMSALDDTIVSTNIPTIVSQIGGLDIFPWVFSSYLLTSTTLIPIFGKLADLYGKKKMYLFGLSLFMAGSLMSACSETMMQLILFRAVQGIGAAALVPITFAMIADVFSMKQRGKMTALFSSVFGLAAVAGPGMGAFINTHLSWHWIFIINVPFGMVAVVLLFLFYEDNRRRSEKPIIDYAGAFLLTGSIVCLLIGLDLGQNRHSWGNPWVIGLLALSVIGSFAFLLVEWRSPEPIIPVRLFGSKLTSASVTAFLQGVILIGASGYIPLFIQGVIAGSASNSGQVLTPLMVSLIVSASISGIFLRNVPFRTTMLFSAVLMGIACSMLAMLNVHTTYFYLHVAMILLGAGIGPLMAVTLLLAQNSIGKEHLATASSLITFLRTIGMAIGVSIFGIIVNSRLRVSILQLTTGRTISPSSANSLRDSYALFSPELRTAIPADLYARLQQSLSSGIACVFAICLGICALSLLLSFMAGNARAIDKQNSRMIQG
ncbi:MDR family MFS transporter [Cohnella mopanensis]|uniref:MDR family MFS transporter n=1 Tax=Cohnella mopanensis TaxID=2911966 RepID=UPI001EF891DA|nr:MDR family MFS transporter [Cohnella mopanensis]